MANNQQSTIKGKLIITATLRLETGLHIGASKEFSPIGAVDSPFIRDSLTKAPIIPGSSLKGKIRTLLVKSMTEGYWLNDITKDPEQIQRMFGAANSEKFSAKSSRLQFFDIKMTEESLNRLTAMELDTYIGEVKFENNIDRITATANPRQIERVPAGAEFGFKLVYNIENEKEADEDMKTLANGIKLLTMDYLGGSGSRGYGRVSFKDFKVEMFSLTPEKISGIESKLENIAKNLSAGGSL